MQHGEVWISDDGMEAVLGIDAGQVFDLELLRGLITEAGICFGLDARSLRKAGVAAEQHRDSVIARGLPMRPPAPDELIPLKPANKDGVRLVADGEHVGNVRSGISGQAGMTVRGEAVPVCDADLVMTIGEGLDRRGQEVFAARSGALLHAVDGSWSVVGHDAAPKRLSKLSLQVTADSMEAAVELGPGEFAESKLLAQNIIKSGIVFGLQKDKLLEATRPVANARRLVVARGQMPEHGDNASIELLIDDDVHFQVSTEGNLDFKSTHSVREVQINQPVALVHAAKKGVSGMTIHGRLLSANDGRDIDPGGQIGEGVGIDPRNPQQIIATRSGIFSRDPQGRLQVVSVMVIEGDLDLHVGNVETNYPVHVMGDVKAGFQLISSGDVTVEGVIEDALVSVGGHLLVRDGLVPGEQPVTVQGDLVAPYIRERKLTTRNCYLTKSMRYCELQAKGDVTVPELIGGNLTAVGKLVTERLGDSETGHAAKIQVGVDFEALEEERRSRAELEQLKKEHDTLEHEFEEASHKVKSYKSKMALGVAVDKKQMKKMVLNVQSLSSDMVLKREAMLIAEQLAGVFEHRSQEAAREGEVRVLESIFPPAELMIGRWARFRADQRLENKVFRLVNGEIVHFAVAEDADEFVWPGTT